MNLLSMRDLNQEDPLPPLGEKVEPFVPATPSPREQQ